MIVMRPVIRLDEIETVAALATEIWNEHFPPIIGQAQVDYMLNRFQSARAIEAQIREDGYEYFTIDIDEKPVGYVALAPSKDGDSIQLSKLYLERSHRDRGVGKLVLERIEKRCAARGASVIWLTVNKNNVGSVGFYRSNGFVVESASVTDIGKGFVMDDYRMTKPIGQTSLATIDR